MTDTYYVRYSWVSKTKPTEEYGTYSGIISEYHLNVKHWWDVKCSEKRYTWTLEGINKI